MSKLLLLKVKMRLIDISVNEIGTPFQTFFVAYKGLGESHVSLWVYTIYKCPLWEKIAYIMVYPLIDQLRS